MRRRVVLADLDGCLISGGAPLPGAQAFCAALGERLGIVSNNSSDTPETLSARLAAMDIAIAPARIALAGAATVALVARDRPGARVAVFAAPPVKEMAEAAGLVPTEVKAEAAILCRDPGFDYDALQRLAALAHGGAPVYAANPDGAHPGPGGAPAPETGALLAALRACVPGLQVRCIGKPDPALFRIGLSALNARAEDAVFIGDNPATDGAGAAAAGLRFELVTAAQGLFAPPIQALAASAGAAG